MADITRAPYAFTVHLTDWGWKVSGRHDMLGDMSLLERREHSPPLSANQFDALWDLLDERVYPRKADACAAARSWLKDAPQR